MAAPLCPSHPRFPVDHCPICEAKIARRELAESDPPDDSERGQDRYERDLERHWP